MVGTTSFHVICLYSDMADGCCRRIILFLLCREIWKCSYVSYLWTFI